MSQDICDQIETDLFFQNFLDNKTNPSRKIGDVTSSLSFPQQIAKLSEGLELLATNLQDQVRKEHGALLSQSSHAGKLANALETVSANVDRLKKGADRLKSHITQPFLQLDQQTKILERLHEASHLLRQCGRFLQLFHQLQKTTDVPEQAVTLYEIENLTNDPDLNKIDFIREERQTVNQYKQRVMHYASRDLSNGLQNGNEEQILKSLQIYANLEILNKCLINLLDTFMSDIKQTIKECFSGTDLSNLQKSTASTNIAQSKSSNRGPGKTPVLGSSQHFRTKFWISMEWLFNEEIYSYCQKVIWLQKSLANVTYTYYSESNRTNANTDMYSKFWTNLEELLKTKFNDAAPHILQCLQQGLPKLLTCAKNLENKLGNKFLFSTSTFSNLEAGYLEKCANNLKTATFGSDCPNTENAENLVRIASTEFSAAIVDAHLCSMVSGVFCACNKEFWTKIEGNIKMGTDSMQVVDNPNAIQIQNTTLANTIFYHQEAVKRMVQNLGTTFTKYEAAEMITENLKEGKLLTFAILQQLIASMHSAVNIILLSMHREPGLNTTNISSSIPSMYMKELNEFLLRAWNTHIMQFNDKVTIDECGRELANQCIELFIHNVAVLRPISQTGRMRLKSDCLHLENALKPIVPDLSVLGRSFRALRALSSLITLSSAQLVEQTSESDGILPSYVILLMLFGHGGSDADFQSPHTTVNWSIEKLIQWLTGHTSERERLELISGALQKYRNTIRKKSIAQYDPVYPLISTYLDEAFKLI